MLVVKIHNNRVALTLEGLGPPLLVTIKLNGNARKHISKLELRNDDLTAAVRPGRKQIREAKAVPIGVLVCESVVVDLD